MLLGLWHKQGKVASKTETLWLEKPSRWRMCPVMESSHTIEAIGQIGLDDRRR
jgi:hypothetical protein